MAGLPPGDSRRATEGEGRHARRGGGGRRESAPSSVKFCRTTHMLDSTKPVLRPRIAPAGLMFLAITSIGWGFNWPVTKFLLAELPPLTLRGVTGVLGAVLLAALALVRGDSLKVAPEIWPRLLVAGLLNVTGWMVLMGLALLWLPASEAGPIAHTVPGWGSLNPLARVRA